MKGIDRTPPQITGDAQKDLRAMHDYLYYLQERLNYILSVVEVKNK